MSVQRRWWACNEQRWLACNEQRWLACDVQDHPIGGDQAHPISIPKHITADKMEEGRVWVGGLGGWETELSLAFAALVFVNVMYCIHVDGWISPSRGFVAVGYCTFGIP